MGHSRQAYYQGRRRQTDRLANAQAVVELVREQRMRQPRMGTRKLHHLLQQPLQRRGIHFLYIDLYVVGACRTAYTRCCFRIESQCSGAGIDSDSGVCTF